MKKVIVNADDFGMNSSCTKAIYEAFQKNLITDTTMVANGWAYSEAVAFAKKDELKHRVGIHFNLTEGKPITEGIQKCQNFCENGRFHGNIQRLKRLNRFEREAVYQELKAQVERLKADGIRITHADSHHHIHTAIFIAPIVLHVCKENGIQKIRLHRNIGTISFCKKVIKALFNGWLHRRGFDTTKFFGSLKDIEKSGITDVTEVMVHPDYDEQGILIDRTDYTKEIPTGVELYSLTNLDQNIEYTSYYEV